MFREFNVKFEDVEMLGGADNLLEGTEITKVIVRGDNNKMSSLDSMLKDCNELDTVEGELDLNGVSDIDNLLEGTELVKSINLKNINNENITANNSFPHVDQINIGGELYNKKAMQNVIASKEWTFDNINYQGTVGDNVVTKEININDNNKVTIQDALEQKSRGFEITGQTYENLVVGNGEVTLIDELTLESIDGSPNEFNPHIEQPVCVEVIEGNTVQDESNIYSIGELQENGTYKIDILTDNGSHNLLDVNVGIGSDGFSYKYNGYIEVTGGGEYYSYDNGGLSTSTLVICYDSNKNQVAKVDTPAKVPNNCKYIKSDFAGLPPREPMVVKGNKKQPYTKVLRKETTQSILLPQPLNKIGDIKDKFYWDDNKGHYCIEENVPKIYLHTLDWTYLVNTTIPEDEISFMVGGYCQNNNITTPSFNEDLMKSIIKHNIPILNTSINNTVAGVDAFAYHGSGSLYFRTKRENLVDDSPIQYLKEKGYFIIVTRPTPNIIDLPHLNKKYSLDTYMPTTYLECTNSPMQPSRLLLESDTVRYKPSALETDADYTIQFECKEKSDKKVKLNLGGSEKEVDVEVGLNHVSITTPSEIDTSLYKDRLFLSGAGNKVADVIVNKGEMNQYPSYFDGVQSVGELQDDGNYKIEIATDNGVKNLVDTNPSSWKLLDGSVNIIQKTPIKVSPNTKYTAYWKSSSWLLVYKCDSEGNTISTYVHKNTGQFEFTTDDSTEYIIARIDHANSDLNYAHSCNLRIFEGEIDFGYEGYEKHRQYYNISVLTDKPLMKIKDIADRLYWDKSKKCYCVEQKVGEFSLDNTILNNRFKDDILVPNHKVIMVERGTLGIDCSSLFSYVDFICDKIPVVRFTLNSLDHKLFFMKGSNDLRLGIRKDIYNSIGEEESKKMFLGKIYYYPKDNSNIVDLTNVEGGIIDLPRLYQRDDTNLIIESGNIKPAKTKIVYKDII